MNSHERLKQVTAAFQAIIQEFNLHPTRLDIEFTMAETVHVYMTAPEFSGKTSTERDLMIWRTLEKNLPNLTLSNISVCVLLAPEEEAEKLPAIKRQNSFTLDELSNMGMNLSANVADPEPQEVLQQITAAIHTIIKTRHLHPTRLEIELSEYDTVQIYMTAPEFSGKTYTEREMMIQPALEKVLPLNVIMNLSLLLLFAPEDEVEETQEERLLVA